MKRFANAQLRDKVYSMIIGECEIIDKAEGLVTCSSNYTGIHSSYTLDGHYFKTEYGEPVLFYVDGENKYATERPKPKVDWAKVPVDTKVLVSNNNIDWVKRYFSSIRSDGEITVFGDGNTSWTTNTVVYYPYVKLAE